MRDRHFTLMRLLCFVLTLMVCTAHASPPKAGPKFESDRGTVGFLRRYLLSGGDIYYPYDAARLKLEGGGFFLMQLRPRAPSNL